METAPGERAHTPGHASTPLTSAGMMLLAPAMSTTYDVLLSRPNNANEALVRQPSPSGASLPPSSRCFAIFCGQRPFMVEQSKTYCMKDF